MTALNTGIPGWAERLTGEGRMDEGRFLFDKVAKNAIAFAVQKKFLTCIKLKETPAHLHQYCPMEEYLFENFGRYFRGWVWKMPHEKILSIREISSEEWNELRGVK
jgi:hypothetical protein